MSRIIIKNLPKKITANELQDIFSTKGCVTDLQLKYTKNGVFRQFAFVGYKTEDDAMAAKEYFHNTYIHASKIQVDTCASLGDDSKPRAWSKHSKEKNITFEVKSPQDECSSLKNTNEKKKKEKKSSNKDTLEAIPIELENDLQFKEFLELNKDRKSKPVWCDDTSDFKDIKGTTTASVSESDGGSSSSEEERSSDPEKAKTVKNKQISDMEYLRSKMKPDVNKVEEVKDAKDKVPEAPVQKKRVFDDQFTLKVKNLPYLCKKKQIKIFFHPLKLESIRIPPKSKGFAYINCKTEKDMRQALNRGKGFLDGHRIDVVKYEKKNISQPNEKQIKQDEDSKDKEESLAESGRIYVRNLCFSVTEEELETLFKKYGPIAEVHLPIDSFTKKPLGFAFVTFMFPNHALKAFSELDGTIFQGRLLHLLPAKPKRVVPDDLNELSFKQRKQAKIKALSGSSHNWNTLFLGFNAVVDIMAEKYNTDKSKLLSCETNDSAAVRLALGETQLVVETRKFLIENGVQLDAFSQPAGERSKTVIIAKNLPAKTSSKEILEVFSKHGLVSKVILPPSGITAIIEFQQAIEAKIAFQRLAYSRFHDLPLYLEWAPLNVFSTEVQQMSNITPEGGIEERIETQPAVPKQNLLEEEEEEEIEEPEPETTLFVKNINFDTIEEQLKKTFQKCGSLHSVFISKKKDIQTGKMLSMGFGFVQYKHKKSALAALRDLQHIELDGHSLELKFSNRATVPTAETRRKKMDYKEQKSTKILVRNIAFEVTEREIRDLFKEFGELKTVRLPKKFDGQGTHRGFGFVDFRTKTNAKRAFEALCHSTHLLGRRLVLEWANPDSEDVDELRRKTARDFYKDSPRSSFKKSKLMEDVVLASSMADVDVD